MAERLRNRRTRAQSHPRTVDALRKSHQLATHSSSMEAQKMAEKLPFSKTWSQRHGKFLASKPKEVSLLAKQAVVHSSHSKSHHRSLSHAAAKTQSSLVGLAHEAASHVVHKEISSSVMDEFKSGMTAQVQEGGGAPLTYRENANAVASAADGPTSTVLRSARRMKEDLEEEKAMKEAMLAKARAAAGK